LARVKHLPCGQQTTTPSGGYGNDATLRKLVRDTDYDRRIRVESTLSTVHQTRIRE
jgi:hypothetical protein